MKLYEYLWKHRVHGRDLAKKIGIHPVTMSRLSNRKESPTLLTALLLNHASGGRMGFDDLLSTEDAKKLAETIAAMETSDYESNSSHTSAKS